LLGLIKEKKMKKPRKNHFNLKRETTTLFFEDDEFNGEFYIRGGVFWPEEDLGFAIVGGQNIENKKIYIFEQASFMTIDNVLNDNQLIEYHGLYSFFNRCWHKYFCNKYFWSQSENTHKRFLLETIRSQMLEPKPYFIPIEYSENNDGGHLIRREQAMGRLAFEDGSELHNQLEMMTKDEDAKLPAVKALKNLLAGYERYPFRRHGVREDFMDAY
jgi:hypothetical protein